MNSLRAPIAWGALLWMGATAAACGLALTNQPMASVWIVIALAAISGIAERQSVRLATIGGTGLEMSVAFLPFVFSAVAFGPATAFAVCALANLGDLRRPFLRWFVYTPVRALTGAGTAVAAAMVVPDTTTGFTWILVASLVAALANLLIDAFFNVCTILVRGTTTPFVYLRTMTPFFVVALPLYVPVVALLVYGYERYSASAVAAFLIPLLALQRVVHLYHEQREAATGLGEANRRLEVANLSFASALVTTLDARDRYTAGHSAAVAVYSRDIAARMNLSQHEQEVAHLCGLVHDIGKVGLPAGLLEKQGPLTLDERRKMQQHPVIGERILGKVATYEQIAQIVRHHHERVDGHGYPDRLSGSAIPLISRIIAVADAYNAMTSDRPYREAMPSRVARLRLAQAVESQFDIDVVAAFEALLASSDETYRLAHGGEFLMFTLEESLPTLPHAVVA